MQNSVFSAFSEILHKLYRSIVGWMLNARRSLKLLKQHVMNFLIGQRSFSRPTTDLSLYIDTTATDL